MSIVELICPECGRTFTRSLGAYNRAVREGYGAMFCSRACHHVAPDAHGKKQKSHPAGIPWLKPRTWQEQALAEMIAGAAIEFQKTLPDIHDHERMDQNGGEDYWSGYWAALIDYGRRLFDVRNYGGPHDHEASTAAAEDGAPAVPEEEMSCV